MGFDAGFSRALASRGWVGVTLPAEYGGANLDAFDRYVLVEELLAAGAPAMTDSAGHDLVIFDPISATVLRPKVTPDATMQDPTSQTSSSMVTGRCPNRVQPSICSPDATCDQSCEYMPTRTPRPMVMPPLPSITQFWPNQPCGPMMTRSPHNTKQCS